MIILLISDTVPYFMYTCSFQLTVIMACALLLELKCTKKGWCLASRNGKKILMHGNFVTTGVVMPQSVSSCVPVRDSQVPYRLLGGDILLLLLLSKFYMVIL